MATVNAAINSFNNALITLLVSNQILELKVCGFRALHDQLICVDSRVIANTLSPIDSLCAAIGLQTVRAEPSLSNHLQRQYASFFLFLCFSLLCLLCIDYGARERACAPPPLPPGRVCIVMSYAGVLVFPLTRMPFAHTRDGQWWSGFTTW